ncbi:MAG: RNA pseudouridine synthase [bacterium]|nr:RNA pseudouridine synthase [bacterium]
MAGRQNDNSKIKIEYENPEILIINKPSGLTAYSTKKRESEDSVVSWFLQYYPKAAKVGHPERPGIVHRLDKQTSGLLIVAKTQIGFEYLSKLFRERQITKEYLALVYGQLPKHGVIDDPLTKIGQRGVSKVRVDEEGKEAVTEYWQMQEYQRGLDQFTFVKVKLHTGRTHQIRVHFAHSRHPVMGDDLYGKPESQLLKGILERQFLHASRLEFKLQDGTWLEVESELPSDLNQVLEGLQIVK